MPPKPVVDENLTFLWTCLKHSDYKKVDFNAVSKALNITSGAANTRFYRLKQRMDPDAAAAGPAKGVKRSAEGAGTEGEEGAVAKKRGRPKGTGSGKAKGVKVEAAEEMAEEGEAAVKDEVEEGEESA